MRRIGTAVFGLMLVTSSLAGQRSALREVRDRGSFGVDVIVAEPLGEFRTKGDIAAGLSLAGVSSSNLLGFRIEASWLNYDNTYHGYGLSTNSNIASLAIGPQITFPFGAHKVYGFATVGGSLFWSSANYNAGCGCSDSDYLDGDFTTTTSAGGGVQLAVSRNIAIDFGVRGVRHERVQYIPAGGLTENPDGTFSAERVETPVEMRVFQVGVSFAIR
jgi:opacity protein-like surface antigen